MKSELTTNTLTTSQRPLVKAAPATREEAGPAAAGLQRIGLAVAPVPVEDTESDKAPTEIDSEQLAEIVDALNSKAANIARQLRFQFDDDANTSVIEVYDRETEELIRQIPSEEVLRRMRFANSDGLNLIDIEA